MYGGPKVQITTTIGENPTGKLQKNPIADKKRSAKYENMTANKKNTAGNPTARWQKKKPQKQMIKHDPNAKTRPQIAKTHDVIAVICTRQGHHMWHGTCGVTHAIRHSVSYST